MVPSHEMAYKSLYDYFMSDTKRKSASVMCVCVCVCV